MNTECPFLTLTQRDLEGPSLDDTEQQGLHDHLEQGCPVCEAQIEQHLTESDGLGVADEQLGRAVEYAAEEMDRGRVLVLDQVQRRLAEEDRAQRRLVRRRMQRVLFYVVSLSTVFLLVTTYMLNAVAIKLKQTNAQTLATRTEVVGLSRALARYLQDHRTLPETLPALLEALQAKRPDGQPYYPLAAKRRAEGAYQDDFEQRYRYLVRGNRALIYSVGPNGKDEEGEGDDITDRGGWVTFVPR